jgi:chromosome segregation ATPase
MSHSLAAASISPFEAAMTLKPVLFALLCSPALLAAALSARATAVAAPETANEDDFLRVASMLDKGWKPSAKGLEAARQEYEALQADGRANPRVTYAFALVQMRNRRYDEARRLLDDVIAADRSDLSARRATVWVLVLVKDYSAALIELEKLMKSLPAEAAGDNADEEEADLAALAEFAGRVVGFIDGPAARSVAEHARADYRKRITAPLNTARRAAFDAGRDAVTRRFAELDLDRQQTKADAKAGQEERKERIKAELDRERAGITAEKTSLDSRADKAREELNKELTAVEALSRPLATQQGRLESQGAAITRDIANLQVEIGRLLDLADEAEDPFEARRWRAEARRLDAVLARFSNDLARVNTDLATVASKRVALEGRRRAALARAQAEDDRIDRRRGELVSTEKRIAGDERRVGHPASGQTGAVASLAAKASAFTTYDDFPFEQERARLLQAIRK